LKLQKEVMNKQIAIFATACLTVSLVIAANILPRVLAQTQNQNSTIEQELLSKASLTNATKSQNTFTYYTACGKPLSHGTSLEDADCTTKKFIYQGTCPSSAAQANTDVAEKKCDYKLLR
jgi:hypothetical protein